MEIERLTIGQMAKLNRVTPETLRHYDRTGLLHPWLIDKETGYRYYHINQSARLDMIQYLQAYGVSLEEIRVQLDTNDSDSLCSLLREQMQTIDKRIKHLKRSRKAIERMIVNHEHHRNLPPAGTIFYEYMPKRQIFVHQSDKNFFDQDDTGYELMLRELKQDVVVNNLPFTYFRNVGTMIRQGNLANNHFFSNEAFFFVEDDYEGPGQVETLPDGLYLCLCANDFAKEIDYARLLLHHLGKSGHTIAGDYVCEVIEELPCLNDAPRDLFFKIQIPVVNH
ncbi:MerR family transcriptional regulator [Scatolibacter rhodanostii]|uniref:MerR family transcriptional regulator n=1 Tax=Scatolibacter rhodanostii TaxID=2014781 RepID=UPI000C077F55|nr:helix-turn-helix domain-containing protein [Scatolibacter rhodanostii]